jgi:hypothetical protein
MSKNRKKNNKTKYTKHNKYKSNDNYSTNAQDGDPNAIKYIGIWFCSTFAIILIITGLWDMSKYNRLKNNCTAEVSGVVDMISEGERKSYDYLDTTYLSEDASEWIHIRVVNDDPLNSFYAKNIYANVGKEKLEEIVTIHYDPHNPKDYYIADRVNSYKSEAIALFVLSGLFLLGVVLILLSTLRKHFKEAKGDI